MTRIQAFISFFAFWLMSAIIAINALTMQEGISSPLIGHAPVSTGAFQTNFKLIYAIQRELKERKYAIKKVSGRLSLQTRGAIMAYQSDHKLPLTADPSDNLLQHILFGGYGSMVDQEIDIPSQKALKISVAIQQGLLELGYSAGSLGSINGKPFHQAIKAFEKDWKLPITGRISGHLIKTMKRVTSLNIKIQ